MTETTVRRVGPQDGQLLRTVRLRALQTDPASFGSTYEREAAFERAEWDEWADEHATGSAAERLYESAGYAPDGEVEESPHTPGLLHVSLRKQLAGRLT